MERPTELKQLTTNEFERLQDFVDRFEGAWHEVPDGQGPVPLHSFIPTPSDPLRAAVLHELIKTDLEIRWRRDLNVTLEEYAQEFPELGTPRSLSPLLVYEEFRVRQRFGDHPPLEAYQARFPNQFPALERLVQEQPIPTATRRAPPPTSPPPPRPAVEAPADSQGLLVSGIYKPIRKIGKGAFGEIWRGEAPGGVEVALKMIFGSVVPEAAERELHALELIKRLRHVFLLPIHAYWQLQDRLLIAMELADGSLRHRLDECRQAGLMGIPVRELLRYFREAAEAIDFLHSRHVLHRDIKPENLLHLERHAKVADFGLARVVEQSQRLVTTSSCGTPAYTAPEVFWRGKVGEHSDQYSLAATYAELRLGRPLFPSRNWYTLMHDHLERTPDLVPLLNAEEQVVRRALAKDPAQRFDSCCEFVNALLRAAPRE
jgi:hypothetical protein